MQLLNKLTTAFFCLFIFSITTQAQSDKVFHTLGFSAFTSGFQAPASFSYSNTYDTTYTYGTTYGFGFIGVEYTLRYTLWDINESFSIGANVSPHLSAQITSSDVGVTDGGGISGSLGIPVYVSANFGEGSSYNGMGDRGGYFGIGYEFMKVLASKHPRVDELTGETHEAITGWGQVKFAAGYRWWSRNDRLKELSFKYGLGAKNDALGANSKYYTNVSRPNSWTLTYSWFLNY